MIDAHADKHLKKTHLLLIITVVSLLAAVVIFALLQTPLHANLIYDLVKSEIHKSGVSNPVTAVLLNFRAYDTLLEFAVFFCVSIACLPYLESSPTPTHQAKQKDGPLFSLISVLVPLCILLSGYMLWVGSFKPGGAFQAGALLAGCGLLLSLSSLGVTRMTGLLWRLLFSASIIFFIIVIGFSYIYTKTFLMFPINLSAGLILFVEFAATFSVAATLYLCYLTVRGKKQVGLDDAS